MLLIILRRRKYSDYVGEPNINRMIFIGGRQEGQSQLRMKTGVGMMYFEETMKQRCRWFQEAGKGSQFAPRASRRNTALTILSC